MGSPVCGLLLPGRGQTYPLSPRMDTPTGAKTGQFLPTKTTETCADIGHHPPLDGGGE